MLFGETAASGGPSKTPSGILDAPLSQRRDREPQLGPAGRADDARGLIEQRKTQSLEGAEDEEEGPLAAAWPNRRSQEQLEAAHEVVGQHAELLPERVGLQVVGGDGIEGELLLELSQSLLVTPAADAGIVECAYPVTSAVSRA